jgi:hypothetical protein
MKFQLVRDGWPVRDRLYEAGTIIDLRSPEWEWIDGPNKLPPNIMALDQEAWEFVNPPVGIHAPIAGPGVITTSDRTWQLHTGWDHLPLPKEES